MVKFDFFGNLQVSEGYIFQVQAHITLFEVGHNGTNTENKLWASDFESIQAKDL